MKPVEKHLTAAVEELKKLAAQDTDKSRLGAFETTIDGLKAMLPYASVGLKVRPSDETLEAMSLLHGCAIMTEEQWNTLSTPCRNFI